MFLIKILIRFSIVSFLPSSSYLRPNSIIFVLSTLPVDSGSSSENLLARISSARVMEKSFWKFFKNYLNYFSSRDSLFLFKRKSILVIFLSSVNTISLNFSMTFSNSLSYFSEPGFFFSLFLRQTSSKSLPTLFMRIIAASIVKPDTGSNRLSKTPTSVDSERICLLKSSPTNSIMPCRLI